MPNYIKNIVPYIFPNKPQVKVGKFLYNDGKYYHQRKTDVLYINPEGLITTHPVGFLENKNYNECTKEEFKTALNTTIFNMNILNGEFK